MKFSIAPSAKSKKWELCTEERFYQLADDPHTKNLLERISQAEIEMTRAKEAGDEAEAKKQESIKTACKGELPAVTWQAYFPNGVRKSSEAEPSGLFMIDIDHCETPWTLHKQNEAKKDLLYAKWKCVYAGITPSRKGLRYVCNCLPEYQSIQENQEAFAKDFGLEIDTVCTDFARCSFMVSIDYIYYIDNEWLFKGEPLFVPTREKSNSPARKVAPVEPQQVDQREGLFGGATDYKGIPLEKLCEKWFSYNGGAPKEGTRNSELYKFATRLRYICDFNEATMLRVMPTFGLEESEMRQLIRSAISSTRGASMPSDFQSFLDLLTKEKELQGEGVFEEVEFEEITDTKMPSLPPVFKQFVECAPKDFKKATALVLLPILGTLGSRLRAIYLDGKIQSPTFQVSLEAPQGSGKSFMVKLADYCLQPVKDHDEEQREKEREWMEKAKEVKLLNVKVNKKDKDNILGEKPDTLIRYVPATISVTQLLVRMHKARGLHLFAMSEEVDTVVKAFKKGFSNFSDVLRCAFDNAEYGQDYASENSFSGIVRLYYNCLFSGTPKAMRRFYPDTEDGLVSRVLFVNLPDQFGKTMPVWKDFTEEEKMVVDLGLERLNQVSIIGDDVQETHLMKLDWLNEELKKWLKQQQQLAVKTNDRVRDTYCRRSALVGFRAGMLAYFLYGEKTTGAVKRVVTKFATWVANCMLFQQCSRFSVQEDNKNTLKYKEIYDTLPNEFNTEMLIKSQIQLEIKTPLRQILYTWRKSGYLVGGNGVFKKTKPEI